MSDLNYEQKLAKVMLKLRTLRPFYSAVYESLKKVETDSVPTMGVSTNTLYYNREFVEKISEEELIFISLHEIAHVALMHVARKENRDQYLWNIACDLYVNESLMQEFGLDVGKIADVAGIAMIKAPTEGCYCRTIDLEHDFVESIYNALAEQGKQNGYFNYEPGEYNFVYTGSSTNNSWRGYGFNKSEHSKFNYTITVEDNGVTMDSDLINNGEDQNTKEQQSRKLIADANVRTQMRGVGVGTGTSNIERLSVDMLKPRTDWRKYFRKYLTSITSTDSSFSKPDKRMYYQKAIYPGQEADDMNYLENIKICIDVSGSISEKDLGGFLYQVKDILKKFKVDAELIYWDASVVSKGSFNSIETFDKIVCAGGGGTNPAAVFEYLDRQKTKPSVILMLTDGIFFSDWYSDINKRKYRDTIWVLTQDCYSRFDQPFGVKAEVKFN